MSINDGVPRHITTTSDRFWLKITRTLPSVQVGDDIPMAVMEKALSRRRIGTNVGICLVAAFGAFAYARNVSRERKKRVAEHEL